MYLFTDEQNGFALLRDCRNEEVCPGVVDVWHQNAQVVRDAVGRVGVVRDLQRPPSQFKSQSDIVAFLRAVLKLFLKC